MVNPRTDNRPDSRRSNSLNSAISNRNQDDGQTNARQRQSKKDEAIRRKAEADLNKKKANGSSNSTFKKGKRVPGTVSALRPTAAMTVKGTTKVTEACRMMAAKRTDCVLVVDDDERVAGIFTSKDLAYRVAAEGLDARSTSVASIMTPDPLCVDSESSAAEALNTMVQRGFRHLPVCNEEGDVVGLLDITKCLYEALEKLDRAFGSSRKLYDALEGVGHEWASQAPQLAQLMDSLKDQINCPTVVSILDGNLPVEVAPRSSVRDAARAMKAARTTAVLIMENETLGGIFTSKDVVLRVLASQLDPATCSVVRVMTPHPDTAPAETTILDALKRMHHGHYLNLPIVNHLKQVIGMADVLSLTYATLEQMNSIQGQDGEASGPMWSKFWGSAFTDDNDTILSDNNSQHRAGTPGSDIFPHESVSAVDDQATRTEELTRTFVFKFRSPNNKVYRLQANSDDFASLRELILSKLLEENPSLDVNLVPALCYDDDEHDKVFLLSDQDLFEAVQMARQNNWHRLILTLAENTNHTQEVSSTIEDKKSEMVATPFIEEPKPLPEPVVVPDPPKPEKKSDPLIPDHLIIPAAVGGGFLAALIAVVIVMKVTSR